jgi:integrase
MARTVQDAKIGTREARSRLPGRRKPNWRGIQPGLQIGYRKPRGRKGKPAGAGAWVMRRWILEVHGYRERVVGVADDFADADGTLVLNFAQAQAKVLELAQRPAGASEAGPLTVGTALELHFKHLEGQGQSTVNQRGHASAHILPVLGNELVAELAVRQLQNFLHALARKPLRVRSASGQGQATRAVGTDPEDLRRRRSSANRMWNTLRAALNYTWRQGLVPSDSAWRRVSAFKNVEQARIRYLTIAESKRLINGADAEFRPLLVAALSTGARYGELCRLKVRDFNPDAGTVAIWVTKAGKPRHVVLTQEGVEFFSSQCAGRDSSALILPRSDGSAWGRSHQHLKIVAACQRAKIEPPITFHGLRHTWASLSVMAGMALVVVARNLGHASIKMVEKHYGHLAPSYIRDEIRERAPTFGLVETSNVRPLR